MLPSPRPLEDCRGAGLLRPRALWERVKASASRAHSALLSFRFPLFPCPPTSNLRPLARRDDKHAPSSMGILRRANGVFCALILLWRYSKFKGVCRGLSQFSCRRKWDCPPLSLTFVVVRRGACRVSRALPVSPNVVSCFSIPGRQVAHNFKGGVR